MYVVKVSKEYKFYAYFCFLVTQRIHSDCFMHHGCTFYNSPQMATYLLPFQACLLYFFWSTLICLYIEHISIPLAYTTYTLQLFSPNMEKHHSSSYSPSRSIQEIPNLLSNMEIAQATHHSPLPFKNHTSSSRLHKPHFKKYKVTTQTPPFLFIKAPNINHQTPKIQDLENRSTIETLQDSHTFTTSLDQTQEPCHLLDS